MKHLTLNPSVGILKRAAIALIVVSIVALTLPATAFAGRLSSYEWSLMQKREQAKASGDDATLVAVLKELISIEEQYDDLDSHMRLAPYYQDLGRYYDKVGEYALARECFLKEAPHWAASGYPDSANTDLARARQLAMEVGVFREVPAERNPGYTLALNEPAYGTYVGGTWVLDGNIGLNYERTAQVYGKTQAVLEYVDWGSPVPNGSVQRANSMGVPFELALQAQAGLDQVKDDSYIRGLLSELSGMRVPVFLRPISEMNGDWTPWGKQPQKYIEKFRLLADLVHRLAPNVAVVWCPSNIPEDFEKYYPGDAYVDWVGVNIYSDYHMIGDPNMPASTEAQFQTGKAASPMDKIDRIYSMYSEKKPIMVGECGFATYSVPNNEDCLTWGKSQLAQFYGYLPLKYPRTKAVFYFSVNQGDPQYRPANKWSNYSLGRVKDDYVRLTQSPYYIPGANRVSTVKYESLDQVGLASGKNTLWTYARMPYPFVGRVQYVLDGKVVAESSQIPFPVTVDVQDGVHTLTLKTWYSDGKEGPSKTYDLTVGTGVPAGGATGGTAGGIGGGTPGGTPATPGTSTGNPGTPGTPGAPGGSAGLRFPDTKGHWAFNEIEGLARLSLIGGYEDGTFRPDNQVSRAEFLKILFGATGLKQDSSSDPYWARGYLSAARRLMVITRTDGTDIVPGFRADDPCSRWEMAVYMVRAAGVKSKDVQKTAFADDSEIPQEWKGTIQAAVDAGLIKGLENNRFGPNEPMTRAQACVVALRVMDHLKTK